MQATAKMFLEYTINDYSIKGTLRNKNGLIEVRIPFPHYSFLICVKNVMPERVKLCII